MNHPISFSQRILHLGAIGLLFSQGQLAQAGWTGSMTGTGFGRASVNVMSSARVSGSATTPAMQNPSAAMVGSSGYAVGAPLPSGSSSATTSRIQGQSGYQWTAYAYAGGYDGTDNEAIQSRITIEPAECAELFMQSSAEIGQNGRSGTIKVTASGTAGTAMLLQGFEYFGGGNPTREELETNGKKKWELLFTGPMELNESDCSSVSIPFTIDTSIENLYFVADGVAIGKSFSVECPPDVVFDCNTPVEALAFEPPVIQGGCGEVTYSYSIDPQDLPLGSTEVYITAVDQAGNQVQCSFTATRPPLTYSEFLSPINGMGGNCNVALLALNRGGIIPVRFTTSCSTMGGPPTIEVRKCTDGNKLISSGPFTLNGNEWSYQWNTARLRTGLYRLITTLQDGHTKTETVIRLKSPDDP